MCDKDDKKCGCQNPPECKGSPKDCSPEQIKKCHGEEKGHPCVEEGKQKKE